MLIEIRRVASSTRDKVNVVVEYKIQDSLVQKHAIQ